MLALQPVNKQGDSTKEERNAWRVVKGDKVAYQQLASRMSRSGAKETTLDYISDFAEQRGIASVPWIASEQVIAEQLGSGSRLNLLPAGMSVKRSCPARPIPRGNNRTGHQSVSRFTRNLAAIWPALFVAKISIGQRTIEDIAASGGPSS